MRPLFTVSVADCRVDTFRAGGKGGQNQNKVESGVRVVHEPSAAVGESREERSQLANKRRAFARMAGTRTFQRWVRYEAARRLGQPSPDEVVDAQMAPRNLRVEIQVGGRWVPAEEARP